MKNADIPRRRRPYAGRSRAAAAWAAWVAVLVGPAAWAAAFAQDLVHDAHGRMAPPGPALAADEPAGRAPIGTQGPGAAQSELRGGQMAMGPGMAQGMDQGMEQRADQEMGLRSEPAGVPHGDMAAASAAVEQDVRLVEELLRLDAQAALAAGRRRSGLDHAAGAEATSAAFGSRAAHAPALRLAAIYGVAGRLHADVMIDGRLHTYRAGRKLPLGVPAGFGAPELERIAGACIELAGDEPTQRLCLSRPEQTAP